MIVSSSASFTDLPVEVIVRIFSSLGVYDLLAVSSLNRSCNAIYKEYLELDYELMAAGVIIGAPLVERDRRLQALRRREERWRTLDMTHRVPVKIPHRCSSLYDISSGFYVLGGVKVHTLFDFIERKTKFLQFTNLSNYNKDDNDGGSDSDGSTELVGKKAINNEWGEIKAEENAIIVDFGLCIDEHDLIGFIEVTSRCVCIGMRFACPSTNNF